MTMCWTISLPCVLPQHQGTLQQASASHERRICWCGACGGRTGPKQCGELLKVWTPETMSSGTLDWGVIHEQKFFTSRSSKFHALDKTHGYFQRGSFRPWVSYQFILPLYYSCILLQSHYLLSLVSKLCHLTCSLSQGLASIPFSPDISASLFNYPSHFIFFLPRSYLCKSYFSLLFQAS